MKFGEAIEHARNGKKIARHGWNGKGMYVYMKPGRLIPLDKWHATMPSEEPTEEEKTKGYVVINPHLDMINEQGDRIIGWNPSQADMLVYDWYIVDKED